ncbi:hypothetical protein Baya_14282 [Bagarius yarrelli]|uniref:Uncharacterized protein n=1 Tax=Bagarius yarrelli TaxID=175774 RepID=A0A556V937_BAGYA|nr:hypothetical protein Baya_14282 [Bagarius yarrelli]
MARHGVPKCSGPTDAESQCRLMFWGFKGDLAEECGGSSGLFGDDVQKVVKRFQKAKPQPALFIGTYLTVPREWSMFGHLSKKLEALTVLAVSWFTKQLAVLKERRCQGAARQISPHLKLIIYENPEAQHRKLNSPEGGGN